MKKHIAAAIALIVILFAVAVKYEYEHPKEWTYTLMGAQVNYSIGERVTNGGQIYECIQWDEGSQLVIFPPAANPDWWAEVQ